MSYISVFRKETDLIQRLGEEKAHLVWVMARLLDESDLSAVASAGLTDGPDDKKIDFVHLDHDGKRLIFTQGFFAKNPREAAPANKASDLNTAAAWLFSGDIKSLPENMRDSIEECRGALALDEIDTIELFYVHNLPESVNVARELQTAEDHLRKILGSASIVVRASELGSAKIQHLYDSQDSHIDVKDNVVFPSPISFTESGPTWKAYVSSVPGIWLHMLYQKYSDALFSANYRGFLGGGRRRRVNFGIQQSAETRAQDFWAFNNGITVLTLSVQNEGGNAHLAGISIINGAQTTGSIGHVDTSKKTLADLKVLCRVIECSHPETVADIVRFNNTQNAITTWDQYSNDPDQKRLVAEFNELGYRYNIKRGFTGEGDQLGIDDVVQPLLSFHGRPNDANRGKNQIFDRKPLYQNAFDGKKARHVIFVYCLSKAIDVRRIDLKMKSIKGELLNVEADQLALMRNLRFKPFFIALVASTIETALGKKCDAQTVGFSIEAARSNSLTELTARWWPVVETLLALIPAVVNAKEFGPRLSDTVQFNDISKQVNSLLYAMGVSNKHQTFAGMVSGT